MLVGFHERGRASSPTCANATWCRARSRHCCRRCASWWRACRSATGCRRSRSRWAIARRATASSRATHVLVFRDPGAADARRRGALRAFADAHGVEFWLQTGGPATVVPFRSRRPRPRPMRCPSSTSSCRSRRPSSRRSTPHVNRVLVRRAVALLDPRAGRARRRLLLRPRQLHAADRAARRRGRSASRARLPLVRARRGECARTTAWQRSARDSIGRRPVRRDAGKHRRAAAARQGADRPAARRRRRARAARCPRRCDERALEADRLRELQPGDARARRLGARARARLLGSMRRAWSTCSRTPRTSSRSRCSSQPAPNDGTARRSRSEMKKGTPYQGAPFKARCRGPGCRQRGGNPGRCALPAWRAPLRRYSLLPLVIPSNASRLLNTL